MPPKKDPKQKQKKEDGSESQLQTRISVVEKQNADLEVQVAFLRGKLMTACEERAMHQLKAQETQTALTETRKEHADILEHQRAQLRDNEDRVTELRQRVDTLVAESEAKDDQIKELEVKGEKMETTLRECETLIEDKQKLEQLVKAQQSMMDKQSKEINRLLGKHDALLKENALCQGAISDLQIRTEDKTDLHILFEDACLVTKRNRRTVGEAPIDLERKDLICTAGMPAETSAFVSVLCQVHVLNLETLSWATHVLEQLPFSVRYGHAICPYARSKIILYGGFDDDGLCADVVILNSETVTWQCLELRRMTAPRPRHRQACCTSRDRLFVYGGAIEEKLTNEMWILDGECLEWKQLLGYGDEPTPRQDAAIAVSEDGRRLYLFGGNDGVQDLNELHTLDVEKQTWSTVTSSGVAPEPRRGAAIAVCMHYLVISGGTRQVANGEGAKQLGDTYVLDLSTSIWETLDNGAWIADFPWTKKEGRYSTVWGNQVVTLKPDRSGKLQQVETLKFLLPGEISQMRAVKKRENHIREKLEIVELTATPNTMEVRWLPPSKNVDRIDHYKLMVATHTGSVASAYEGKELRHRLCRLRQNTEYVLCVKAVYDDGSFVWSDSKAQRTRCVA